MIVKSPGSIINYRLWGIQATIWRPHFSVSINKLTALFNIYFFFLFSVLPNQKMEINCIINRHTNVKDIFLWLIYAHNKQFSKKLNKMLLFGWIKITATTTERKKKHKNQLNFICGGKMNSNKKLLKVKRVSSINNFPCIICIHFFLLFMNFAAS